MEHRILRAEKSKDKNGKDEVFVHIEINDGKEIYHHAEWLPAAEVAQFLADEKAIEGIAQGLADRKVLDRPASIVREQRMQELRVEQVKLETAKVEAGLSTRPVRPVRPDRPILNK